MTSTTKRSLLPAIVVTVALFASVADAADAGSKERTVSTAGVSLQIHAGWQAKVSRTRSCDPERLIVSSSTSMRIPASGQLPSPRAGAVLVVLLEDRYRQDRPVGNLHRPQHFSVTWEHLTHIKPSCGLPDSPAYMRFIKTHGRYLGFIVYPGTAVDANTREATLTLMDSLRVNA